MFKKLLILTSFVLAFGLVGIASAELVGHWEFDGDLTSVDGVGQDGIANGDVGFEEDSWRGLVLDLPGGDNQFVDLGSVGISGNMPRTIACWAKADHTNIPDWTLVFGFTGDENGEGGNGSHFNIGSLGGPGGVGAHCWGWEETIFSDDEALNWHHYAMTYDGTTILYYGDGQLMDTDEAKSNVQDLSISADRVYVGSRITQASSFPGNVDDARVYDTALTEEEIREVMGPGFPFATDPSPADGAVDVDTATLDWVPGAQAVSHLVYLNGELLVETDQNFAAVSLDPGATYEWQVNEVQEDGTVFEGDVWTFTTLPLEAHFPSPADGAEDVAVPVMLSWVPGKSTVLNDLYIGTDEEAVRNANPASPEFMGKIMQASFDAGDLGRFATVYWRVDAFTPTATVPGPVWSFSTEGFVPVLEGSQTLEYDNSVEPYVTELALDTQADLTAGGRVTNLTLNFQGMESNLSIDEETGTYEVTGEGADVWGSSDAFHYVYMTLNGDGEISARVVSNGTGSNAWAKGGVMIRETTAPDSKQMLMGMTGGEGGGIAFQGRFEDTGANSSGLHGDITASPPYWVRLVREGNEISGYHSADGETWELFTDASPDNSGGAISNPMSVEMADPVLIGLFVTSHADGENRTYTFDNVDLQGDVGGEIISEDIASVSGNSAEPVYVALEDAAGAVATITHPDPAATQLADEQTWTIPVSAFGGVDLAAVSKLYVGVGDGEPGGAGAVTVSDIKVVNNDEVDIDIVFVSDMYDDNADGIADDIDWVKLLLAQGYVVDYTAGAGGLGDGYWRVLDDEKIATLNAADLVIVSRNSNSGDYDDDDEIAQWNAITSPLILSSTHIVRNSRWNWVDSADILNLAPVMELADGTAVDAIDASIGQSSFIDAVIGNGTVLSTGDGLPWIFEFEAGVEFYDGAGQTAGGPRMFFTAGSQETAEPLVGRGELNLTAEGQQIFLDAVDMYIRPNLIGNPGLEEDLSGAPWNTYGDASMEVVHELVDANVPDGPIEGDHCLHVTVNSAGANFWDAGLQSAGKVFEAGKSYTFSVWLKSKSGPFQINMKPERAADPWEGYGEQQVTITEEWEQYTLNTGVIPETVEPASITFHIAFDAGEFYVDDASFKAD